MLDFCSSVLPHYPHSLRLVPFPVKMFLHGNASWELAPAASDAGLSEFFTICSFPLPTVFHTADVGGLGISSAGSLMETGILKTLPVLKHSIKAIANDDVVFNQCFKIADLGCSSGRNTLLVASNIIDIVIEACKENKRTPPQIQVCLNDLFGNDFNNLFKMLPDFYEKVKKKGENVGSCFVSAVPGSFYDRLFPDQSLHLVYSSYSVHWLSQVPEGLENNTLNVYMAKTSPPNVFQAYGKQFITDFTEFLQLRSKELVRGGRMVLTRVGRSEVDPTSDDGCGHLELLAQSLMIWSKRTNIIKLSQIPQGRVQESDIYAFNIPIYYPCEEEVRNVIESQGSFSLDSLNVFEVNWDPNDTDYTNMNDLNEPSRAHGKNAAKVETGILKTLPVLKHSIKAIANDDVVFNQCFKIADLGCSSGRNTLLVASNIIDIVIDACKENKRTPPQIQVCLNDLFGNDFNNLFKMLPDFYEKVKKKGENVGSCFVSAVPGSFYDRLFPDQSLHLVYSTYSVHWLSQVPEGLENNTLNVYMAKTSPPNVIQAYGKQFITDFTEFLQLRSEELVRGGRMVLTLVGRSEVDPTSDDGCGHLELLAQSLHDLVKEGRVQESDIYSFNIPIYYPCEEEVRNVIESQGSFSLDSLNVFEVNWDPNDTDYTNMNDLNEPSRAHGKNAAKVVRAYTEPLLTSQFGNSIIDAVFKRYEKHVAEYLANKKTRYFNLVISLTKK
ncbi:benzoate carboxyl methyltransferase [Tanacetum coccineum]|uniref:Benzoate carboxyl methyltransferase n=1 Tax=Tanacetum coccineum TaxID=301880 RepID=A0ABQ5I628_9ASTR